MASKDHDIPPNGNITESPESDDELKTPNGSEEDDSSNDVINLLQQEIQSLRKDRSELQAKMEATLSEMEQSEVGTKALAAHVSYLEGEVLQAQEDATNASSAALDAENEVKKLKSEIDGLKERITDLELERGRKDGEIRVLKEEVRVLEEKKVILEKDFESKIDAVMNKNKEMMEEEAKVTRSREEELEKIIKIMKDENLELERELLSFKSKREEDLEKALKEMEDKNLELEGLLKEKDEINVKSREMSVASKAKVNWGAVVGAAVSSGAVAVVVTALFLRQKQRC